MSIKQKLFMFIAILGILVLTFTFTNLRDAWDKKNQLEIAYHGSETINLFLDAAAGWSLERRLTESALSGAMAASDTVQNNIKDHGDKADTAYKTALTQLSDFEFPKKKNTDSCLKNVP